MKGDRIMAYYAVTAQRGHCGTKQSIDIVFAIEAPDAYMATRIARRFPAIKRNWRISAREISFQEYELRSETSAYARLDHEHARKIEAKRGRRL